MNPRVKILIIAGSIILVILIAVTVIVGNLTKSDKAGQQSSLIPTGTFEESSGGSQGTGTQALDFEQEEKIMSEEEISRLEELKNGPPVDSADFTISYSSELGEFFVQTKTPQGEAAFRQYMAANQISNVLVNFPELFNIGTLPVDQLIRQREVEISEQAKRLEEQQRRETASSQVQQSTKQKRRQKIREENEKDVQSFSRFVGSLINMNFTDEIEIEKSSVPGPSSGGGKGDNLPTPQPYNGSGTPQLKRIMSVIKAISGLTWGGICATSGHISNSEHYQCNAVDVFGAEGLLDNTFTSLLAAAKKNQLPIHCLIYERFSYSREYNWAKHSYSGASTHDSHIHISGWPSVGGAC